MSITRGQITQKSSFVLANTSPVGGGDTMGDATEVSEDWTPGTTSDKFDKAATFKFTIAALGTQLIDLQTDLGIDGAALGLAELRHLRIRADATNVGNVTLEVDASNGFAAWIDTVGAALIIVAGSTHGFTAGLDGGYVVDATNKELLLTNLDASNAAILYVDIVGASA